jgi:hypothetical protein
MSAQIQYEVEFQKTVGDGGYVAQHASLSDITPYKEEEAPMYYK